MALGATFWATNGDPALWHDISTWTDWIRTLPTAGSSALIVGPIRLYQEPVAMSGNQSRVQENPGYDSGYFYCKELASSGGTELSPEVIIWATNVFLTGSPEPTGSDDGHWELLQPFFEDGDLIPGATDGSAPAAFDKNPVYKTGFINKDGDAGVPYQYSIGPTDAVIWLYARTVTGHWRLWHYSPYAWTGTPPEVIAAAAMKAGLDVNYIDQTAFDIADDAYGLTTGDAPWKDLDTHWKIYAPRVVGEKVSDFLLKCAEHGRDLLYINEAGILSTSSFTRPANVATGVTLADDQLLDLVNWETTLEHTFNTVKAGWGSASRQSWEESSGPVHSIPYINETAVSLDPTLGGKPAGKWVHEDSDSGSVAQFGRLWLKGTKTLSNFRGTPQETEISHYPFLLSPHVNRATLYKWDPSVDGGGMLHVTNWLASDAKPRRKATIKQGPLGFDLGIGDLIEDLEITGDGYTIAESRVIERTYNFDDLTIQSTILEIPPNT